MNKMQHASASFINMTHTHTLYIISILCVKAISKSSTSCFVNNLKDQPITIASYLTHKMLYLFILLSKVSEALFHYCQ